MRLSLLPCSCAILAVIATFGNAGTMTTMLVPSVRYADSTFSTILPFNVANEGSVYYGQPGVYQVDILFTATAGAGEKGWANTLFDAAIEFNSGGSNLNLDLLTGYSPNSGTLDINGASPGGVTPIYGTNIDAGTPGDLKGLLASIASATINTTANDTRNLLGTPQAPANAGYPSLIGSIFVNWNGLGGGFLVLNNQQLSFTTTANTFANTQTGAGAWLFFGITPEPTTFTLMGIAMLGGLGLVRRRG